MLDDSGHLTLSRRLGIIRLTSESGSLAVGVGRWCSAQVPGFTLVGPGLGFARDCQECCLHVFAPDYHADPVVEIFVRLGRKKILGNDYVVVEWLTDLPAEILQLRYGRREIGLLRNYHFIAIDLTLFQIPENRVHW